jgi:8-oxo-(d)GTP phosphatase
MASPDPRSPVAGPERDVVAAGAVVVRRTDGGQVLLVHRPKYDDWAWPKGKQEPGEHVTATAVREVLEETGVEVRLGRPLPGQLYPISRGRTKQVHYWTGRVMGDPDVSTYVANDEIDQVLWASFEEAQRMLTYADDAALLEQVRRHPRRTSALVVLRHGVARARATWEGRDDQRPLTRASEQQAAALAQVLAAYGVTRIVSSDSLRCRQTVEPYADDQVLEIDADPRVNEEAWTPKSVGAVVAELLSSRECAVLCSHRPVLPSILDALGVEAEPLAPGEMMVCHHRKGRVVALERHGIG